MEPDHQRITGTVARARLAPGSKSDRVGVVLRTARGDEYILRRAGGNAFRDETLEKLVGATVTGTGLLTDQTFIMKDWSVKDPP
jgi:hypothetical protein